MHIKSTTLTTNVRVNLEHADSLRSVQVEELRNEISRSALLHFQLPQRDGRIVDHHARTPCAGWVEAFDASV